MDVCAEITAAAPQDQRRFSVSCEVMGLCREKCYQRHPAGDGNVTLHAQPRQRLAFPVQPLVSPSGNDSLFLFSLRCLPLRRETPEAEQEKPALIHGETFVWSANITAKQISRGHYGNTAGRCQDVGSLGVGVQLRPPPVFIHRGPPIPPPGPSLAGSVFLNRERSDSPLRFQNRP